MDEGAGVERVVGALSRQPSVREQAELLVDEGTI